jgi:hypothetical protein
VRVVGVSELPLPFVGGRIAAGRCKIGLRPLPLPLATLIDLRPIFVNFSVGNIFILPFKYLLSDDPHP